MCNNCIHKPVCSIYTATGGEIIRCRYHREGLWEDRYGGKYANPLYECSRCGIPALYECVMNVLGHEKIVQKLTDFCPHCGADMRKPENDTKCIENEVSEGENA